MNIPVKNTRIASLDGWRAVAILLVLGSHFPYSVGFPERLGWTGWIFDGDLGVRIFFVLSGFLISHLLHREAEKNGFIGLKDFFIRRVFRIFPIYFAYLAVLAVLQSLGMYSDAASSWLGCLTFSRNIVGRGDSATVHFWSLAVEEQFYMLWPLAFSGLALWRRRGLAALLLVIPLLACPLARAWAHPAEMEGSFVARLFGPRSIVMYADSLAVGCLGALGVAGWRGGGVAGWRGGGVAGWRGGSGMVGGNPTRFGSWFVWGWSSAGGGWSFAPTVRRLPWLSSTAFRHGRSSGACC